MAADVVKLKLTAEGSTVKIDATKGVKVNDSTVVTPDVKTTALSMSLTLCRFLACLYNEASDDLRGGTTRDSCFPQMFRRALQTCWKKVKNQGIPKN